MNFIADRIGLIPLYINPLEYQKQYLFHLNVKNNTSEPTTTITAKDFNIYPLKKDVDPTLLETIDFNDYDKENKLSDKQKEASLNLSNSMVKITIVSLQNLKQQIVQHFKKLNFMVFQVFHIHMKIQNGKQYLEHHTLLKRMIIYLKKNSSTKIKINDIQKSKQAKFKKIIHFRI